MRSLIARVIFGLALTTVNLTKAGWFDNGEEDDIRKRRERGRQEDTV